MWKTVSVQHASSRLGVFVLVHRHQGDVSSEQIHYNQIQLLLNLEKSASLLLVALSRSEDDRAFCKSSLMSAVCRELD